MKSETYEHKKHFINLSGDGLVFRHFLAYFISLVTLIKGQGGFIYNEFRKIPNRVNQPITDMIETIERYARLQPD